MTNRYQQLIDQCFDSLLARVNAITQPVPRDSQASEFRLVTMFPTRDGFVAIIERVIA